MKLKVEAQGAVTGLVVVAFILAVSSVPVREVAEIILLTAALVALVFLIVEWIIR